MARECPPRRHHCGRIDARDSRDPDRGGVTGARRRSAGSPRGRGGRTLRAAAGARPDGRGARDDPAGPDGDAPDYLKMGGLELSLTSEPPAVSPDGATVSFYGVVVRVRRRLR